MGGSASSRIDDPPPKDDESRSLQCPKCSSILKPLPFVSGCRSSPLECLQCGTKPLCKDCLYPCPKGTCTNKSCQVVLLLLTCDRIEDPHSKVHGCPVFRACPKCHCLMKHDGGCNCMTCPQCRHAFCFKCLSHTDHYLICSIPEAPRQRFQT